MGSSNGKLPASENKGVFSHWSSNMSKHVQLFSENMDLSCSKSLKILQE